VDIYLAATKVVLRNVSRKRKVLRMGGIESCPCPMGSVWMEANNNNNNVIERDVNLTISGVRWKQIMFGQKNGPPMMKIKSQ